MPEGTLCNKQPIETEEALKTLLSDTRGRKYYEEMQSLEVDTEKLWSTIQKTCKSRTRTWLEMCAHCGLCAERCPTGAWDMQKFTLITATAGDTCMPCHAAQADKEAQT